MNESTKLTENFSSKIKWETDKEKIKTILDYTKIDHGNSYQINSNIDFKKLKFAEICKSTIVIFEYFLKTDNELIIGVLFKENKDKEYHFKRLMVHFTFDILNGDDSILIQNIFLNIIKDYNTQVFEDDGDHIKFNIKETELITFLFDPNVLDEKFMEVLLSFCIQKSKAEQFLLADYGSGSIGICNSNNPVIKNITEAMNKKRKLH